MKRRMLSLASIVSMTTLILLGGYISVNAQAPAAPNQTYELLTPLPLSTTTSTSTANTSNPVAYIQTLYKIVISLAVVVAVFMIVLGGITTMSTDNIENRREGKRIVNRAIFGLVLIIISYLILYTINPDLINLGTVFQSNIR